MSARSAASETSFESFAYIVEKAFECGSWGKRIYPDRYNFQTGKQKPRTRFEVRGLPFNGAGMPV
jgi:hypothetical protein